MWLRRFTSYLLRHRLVTIAFAFFSTFIPVIGIVGILIAALVTLCKGVVEGAIVTVAATLPYVISFYLSGSTNEESFPVIVWIAISIAVISNLLTWVFAVMLRRHVNWSLILQIAALLGVLVVSVIHLAFPEVADWWGRELQSYYAQSQALGGLLKTSGISTEKQIETISITKEYLTGLVTVIILFNAILQLIVARWWQSLIFNPGGLRRELQNIRLSQLAGVLFLASLILSSLGNKVALDIMPIVYMLFGAAGLSLAHFMIRQMNSPTAWFWLSLLYVLLFFSLVFSQLTVVVLIAVFAFADIWLDLRKRAKS